MIIVKNSNTNEIECSHCKSILQYADDDIHDVHDGYGFVCPKCGNEIIVKEIPHSRPIYPTNFFDFKDGKPMDDKTIQKWCNEAFECIKNGNDYCELGSGDTSVIGLNYEDEIEIIVAKKYKVYNYLK